MRAYADSDDIEYFGPDELYIDPDITWTVPVTSQVDLRPSLSYRIKEVVSAILTNPFKVRSTLNQKRNNEYNWVKAGASDDPSVPIRHVKIEEFKRPQEHIARMQLRLGTTTKDRLETFANIHSREMLSLVFGAHMATRMFKGRIQAFDQKPKIVGGVVIGDKDGNIFQTFTDDPKLKLKMWDDLMAKVQKYARGVLEHGYNMEAALDRIGVVITKAIGGIHFFPDGNGRTQRMLGAVLLGDPEHFRDLDDIYNLVFNSERVVSNLDVDLLNKIVRARLGPAPDLEDLQKVAHSLNQNDVVQDIFFTHFEPQMVDPVGMYFLRLAAREGDRLFNGEIGEEEFVSMLEKAEKAMVEAIADSLEDNPITIAGGDYLCLQAEEMASRLGETAQRAAPEINAGTMPVYDSSRNGFTH